MVVVLPAGAGPGSWPALINSAVKVDSIEFGPFTLGPSAPVLVVAEIGVNHNGDPKMGLRQLHAAVAAGARAVKFQSFRASELATKWSPAADYQRARNEETQFDMLSGLEMTMDHFVRYRKAAAALGAIAFSSPFDPQSLRALVAAGVELVKVASGEITNVELLRAIAETRLPTLMSTGMSNDQEVSEAVSLFREARGGPLALLHCVSSYPAPLEELNLRAIPALRDRFAVPVGLSDHTIGRDAAVAAVALGADIIEKHFTIDRSLPGPDHAMSMEPTEFVELIETLRKLRTGLGTGVKSPAASELQNRTLARRSVVAARDLPRGTLLTPQDVALKRPGGGLQPSMVEWLVGRRILRGLRADEQIRLEDLSE
jgi:N,N'-diacetyllegionaminate synthase